MEIPDKNTALLLWSRISGSGPGPEAEKLLTDITGLEMPALRFEDDRTRHLTGLALAEYGAFYMKGKRFPVETGQNGKPFFTGSDLFFHISHSGLVAACGFCLSPIGVDIEQPGRNIEKVADRFFHPDEVGWIRQDGFSPEKALLLWSYKESFLKSEGKGIGQIGGLASMVDGEGPVREYGQVLFDFREILPGYRLVSCTDRKVVKRVYIEVTASQLRDFIQNIPL